jgi:hypothetical protein
MQGIHQFDIGQTYTARSVCDHDCIFAFKVTERRGQMITLVARTGTYRRKVFISDGAEAVFPLGRYSMAPMLRATPAPATLPQPDPAPEGLCDDGREHDWDEPRDERRPTVCRRCNAEQGA